MRSSQEFRLAVRRGVRAARGPVVVHARRAADSRIEIGFVVSKAVGIAVTRNRVKRRLRHAARDLVADTPPGTRIVIRALPGADRADDLTGPLADAWERSLRRLASRTPQARP